MAKRVAKFEKVSFDQFKKDWDDTFTWADMMAFGLIPDRFTEPDKTSVNNAIKNVYNSIVLPKRATMWSAGYDFFSPITFILEPGQTIKIPTSVRCWMNPDWVLKCYPRSGLGFKYRLQLNNTVGIIDSDYFYSDNEGHIFAKLTNDTNEGKTVTINSGNGFMQGIFIEYGITEDDHAKSKRNGGFGSTDKKEE